MEFDYSLFDAAASLPFADVNIEALQSHVAQELWKKWTEEDKMKISAYINYHTDSITYLTECWAHGPSSTPPPNSPPYDIELVMKCKSKKRSRPTPETSTASKNRKKAEKN